MDSSSARSTGRSRFIRVGTPGIVTISPSRPVTGVGAMSLRRSHQARRVPGIVSLHRHSPGLGLHQTTSPGCVGRSPVELQGHRWDRVGGPAPEGKRKEEKVESKEALGPNPSIVVTQKIWELQGTHVNFRQGSPVHLSNAAHRHIHTLCNSLPRHPLYVF